MIRLIVKKFIKDYDKTSSLRVREAYGVLGGILGIVCNIFLFLTKIIVGGVTGSIAIISDAFNNLSDSGASTVAIIGAKLSNKRADSEHPLGHGRLEYISSMIVGFIIILFGFELLKSSIGKIIEPKVVELNIFMILILVLSVLVKFWMYNYNKFLGDKIKSKVLVATAKDSLNDVVSTCAVIIAIFLAKKTGFYRLDGIVGVLVSLIILKSGWDIAVDTVGVLLGKMPDKNLVSDINNMILNADSVVGVHDLVIHDYGPGRIMGSVHAEVPDDSEIVKIHNVIDELEKRIEKELGVHIVIHMDPISVDCEDTKKIKEQILKAIRRIDSRLNIHDFRVSMGDSNIKLIFDLEVPEDYTDTKTLEKNVIDIILEENKSFEPVFNIDIMY